MPAPLLSVRSLRTYFDEDHRVVRAKLDVLAADVSGDRYAAAARLLAELEEERRRP